MEDAGLAEHSVVLDLGLGEGRAVGGDDDEFGLAGAERLEGGLVAQSVLTGLDHQPHPLGDGFLRVTLLNGRHGGKSSSTVL